MFKSVILARYHIDFAYHGFAIINALALANVMLTAKDLHLGEQFDDAPLIYPTLLKSAVFSVVLACFEILEEAAIGLYHHQSFQQSIADLGGGSLNIMVIELPTFLKGPLSNLSPFSVAAALSIWKLHPELARLSRKWRARMDCRYRNRFPNSPYGVRI